MTKDALKNFTREFTSLMPSIMRGVLKRQSDEITAGIITMPQYIIMDMLKNKGAMKMTEIASEMNITLPAATGFIERMHALKMLVRIYDKNDRRVIRIALTPKGSRLVSRIRLKREVMVGKVFGQLSENERQTYLRILRKVHHVIYN